MAFIGFGLLCLAHAIAQPVAAQPVAAQPAAAQPVAALRPGGSALEVVLELPILPFAASPANATSPASPATSSPSPASPAQPLYIAWGDGLIDTVTGPGSYPHRYAAAGRYTVRLLSATGPLWDDTILVAAAGPNDIVAVSGTLSLDAYLSTGQGGSVAYGGENGVLSGITVGASINVITPSKQVRLSSEDLNVNRPNVRFELLDPHATLAVQLRSVPTDLSGAGRRNDDVASFSVRPPNLPQAQLVYVGSRQTGADAYAVEVLRFSLSDRYLAVTPGLDQLRWRVDLQSTNSSVAATSQASSSQAVTARIDGRITPDPAWELRPQLRMVLRWDQQGGVATAASQRYETSLAADRGPDGGSLGLSLTVPDSGAGSNEQELSLHTRRLAPFTLRADLSRREDAGTRYRYGVGASVPVLEGLELGAGYRGESGTGGHSNGVEATLLAKLARAPWDLRLQAAGGAQFHADGRIDPSANLVLSARGALAAVDLTTQAALRLSGGLLSGTVDASAHMDLGGAVSLDAGAGVQLATRSSLRGNLDLAYDLTSTLALHLSSEARAQFSDPANTVATVGVGLRYSFGGLP